MVGVRIGEIADHSGVTTKTLRFYESVGLLEDPGRDPSGYRDYPRSVLDRLKFIRTAQAVGLTLGEIRGIIAFRERSSPPCTHVVSLIESRAADLDRRIVELRNLREELRRLARTSRTLSPDACSPDLVCHIINPAHHEPFRAG